MLGVHAEEGEIVRLSRTRKEDGTDEAQLARAARKFRCDLTMVRRLNPDQARRDLKASLRRGVPVLLCIFEWAHWVTVVKEERGKFIMLDSSERSVLLVLTWKELKKEWVYHQRDKFDDKTVHTVFDLHLVVPRFPVSRRTRFSVAAVRHLRRPENRIISHRWNEYVDDLQEICKVRTPRSERVISLGEFLRRHQGMILDQVTHWHGNVERRAASRILAHLRFVAETLGQIIPEESEKRAIAALAVLLTLWAEGEEDGAPIYSPPRPVRRNKPR